MFNFNDEEAAQCEVKMTPHIAIAVATPAVRACMDGAMH